VTIAEKGCPARVGLAGRAESGHERYSKQNGNEQRVGTMSDLLNLAMLIGGSVGSLAFGVLAAYGILRMGFLLICPRPQRVAVKVQPEAAL
jgi:hypothetical protein